jgi:pimeloyl-ACP methyl ester carboxylesterase
MPLVLSHGWPWTSWDFQWVIGPLADPVAHGGDPADSFDVVVPSLPGFGFSGPTTERGWNRYRIADAMAELMRRLGYERYLVAGNDVGSIVGPELGRRHPDAVRGVHVTQIFSFPSGDPAEFENLTPQDFAYLEFLQKWNAEESGFNALQSTKPHHLAHALLDSPAGQLGWSAQLLAGAGAQHLIENAALYWLTGTGPSSTRLYFEDAHAEDPAEPTTAPMGLSSFANDVRPLRPFADRDHTNIVMWQMHERGGHWASRDAGDLLVADIRTFSTQLD